MKKPNLKGKMFLDEDGATWEVYSEAGTGEYYWWARHVDTGQEMTFPVNFLIKKVGTFAEDVRDFEEKQTLESNMFNMIVRLSEKVLRHEMLNEEDWSKEDLDLIFRMMNGKFEVRIDD